MDDSYHLYKLKNQVDSIITFDPTYPRSSDHHEKPSQTFNRCSTINDDDDDDDIIILDPPDIVEHEVKSLLNSLIHRILEEDNVSCQIIDSIHRKRSLDNQCEENCLSKKKVRSDDTQHGQDQFDSLFVSNAFDTQSESKASVAQFLYHLGFDRCLEEYANEQSNSLSHRQKDQLKQFNQPFHHSHVYSCKYCSFQTDSIHVLSQHYLTPHILANDRHRHDKYRCTYCAFQTFRVSHLRGHFERKHHLTLTQEPSNRRYSCNFCTYDTDDKVTFRKHQNRCQIAQERVRLANNLLAPTEQLSVKKTLPM